MVHRGSKIMKESFLRFCIECMYWGTVIIAIMMPVYLIWLQYGQPTGARRVIALGAFTFGCSLLVGATIYLRHRWRKAGCSTTIRLCD